MIPQPATGLTSPSYHAIAWINHSQEWRHIEAECITVSTNALLITGGAILAATLVLITTFALQTQR